MSPRFADPRLAPPRGAGVPALRSRAYAARLLRPHRVLRRGRIRSPKEPIELVEVLTARMAPTFGLAKWKEVSLEHSRFLLSHIMRRGFSPNEEARAPHLLAEFESFARVQRAFATCAPDPPPLAFRSEEHTSELQSLRHLVCRLL